eukprot:TRINITY_DN24539_c0_g1_i1.p1 TRINITY_DN24539_c0_g1~~TRINITY_DN24539_c0_g1_i1.p1  ORF type:complete len:172 (-),score=14.64 TRINITY_DN24539_c0_g1_i1:272-787(-)
MIVETPPPARGSTVFCEDIRHEIGGKLSLTGVVSAAINVRGNFPIKLDRFALLVTYMERIGAESGPLELRVYYPGDGMDTPTVRSAIPGDQIRSTAGQMEVDEFHHEGEPHMPHLVMQFPLDLGPVEIKEAGQIRVRMLVGDRLVRLGSLTVTAVGSEDGPDEGNLENWGR